MHRFIKKIIFVISVFLSSTFAIFLLIAIAPGNPYENWPEEMLATFGTDLSLWEQYGRWLLGLLTLDLGQSLVYQGEEVLPLVFSWFSLTMLIVVGALLASLAVSIPLSYGSVFYPHSRFLRLLVKLVETLSSIPIFILGFLAVVFMHNQLATNAILRDAYSWTETILFYLMIFLITGIGNGTAIEFIKHLQNEFRRIKGQVHMTAVVARAGYYRKHLVRNAAIPLFTIIANRFIYLISGAVIIEYLFRIPGIGVPGIRAAIYQDYPLLLGIAAFTILTVLLLKVIFESLSERLDPHIREV